ncbi:MAG: hypothetical protein AAF788_04710 [Pseudomonadota bacterium]
MADLGTTFAPRRYAAVTAPDWRLRKPMAQEWTTARVRIAIAQLCQERGIDITLLYEAIGINMVKADSDALAHLAGVIDGLEAAAKDEQRATELPPSLCDG